MAKKLSSLSVFFPAYNDAKSIPQLVKKSFSILPNLAHKFEIIVINDGSPDETASVLDGLKEKYPELKVVTHKANRGYGGALRSGFAASRYDFVFYTDGDGQYDPKELPNLVEKMDGHVDLVNGYKIERSDSFYRKLIGDAYALWARALLGIKFADVDCDFRLFRRKTTLDRIKLTANSGAICAEMLIKIQKLKTTIVSVPVHHYPRKFGSSQFFTPERIIKTLFDDLHLWWELKTVR